MILHSTKLELPLPIGALGQSEKLKEKGVKKKQAKKTQQQQTNKHLKPKQKRVWKFKKV